jgi:hypothetical protein
MRTILVLCALTLVAAPLSAAEPKADAAAVAGRCMTCHKDKSPGLYLQWYRSEHARHKVTCIECHKANPDDPDAYEHEGALIATLVTPADCGRCHLKEYKEVDASYHATAGEILDSADAYLAHAAGGHPVAVTGCESCHGGRVIIDPASPNRLSSLSWPNSGIGRINPDGSKGACNACHTRHSFDKAQARRPEACGKCHLGPDHPQKEIYEESKHGNTFFTNVDKMNLDADRWVVGQDYFEAPTCATCHMSAAPGLDRSHDVGRRISWTLRPPISKMKDGWKERRDNMKTVCRACHGTRFVEGHYEQFDGTVQLYNVKFAEPATRLMKMVADKGLMPRKAEFGNDLEWIYWELWHHEGRRARHGVAMMGPDYTWWHGMYEVAKHFYFKFLPALEKLGDPEIDAAVAKLLAEDPMHQWLTRETGDIKQSIRNGELQKVFQGLYKPGE